MRCSVSISATSHQQSDKVPLKKGLFPPEALTDMVLRPPLQLPCTLFCGCVSLCDAVRSPTQTAVFAVNQLNASSLSTGWPFGSLVCKMSGMVQGISVSASVFTLVAIAVDRYCGCVLLLLLHRTVHVL